MSRTVCFASVAAWIISAALGIAQAQPRIPSTTAGDQGGESATHEEVEPLGVEFGQLSALRLRSDGTLLAGDSEAREVKLIGPDGNQTGTIKLDFAPEAIDVDAEGVIYVGGQGHLAALDKNGTVLRRGKLPGAADAADSPPRRAREQPARVSGIALSGRDLFVAEGAGWSLGSKSKLYRFDLNLENPQLMAEGLRGCCQRCDIVARDGVLYLAENSVHRVVLYDREGEVLGKWGERSRTELEGFGACCNPMNLCFGHDGALYTAESGLGRVKRYSADGKFLGLVGYVGTDRFEHGSGFAASCSNIAIAVAGKGDTVFVMDYRNKQVRVLKKKP
jgi:hypothetical protein